MPSQLARLAPELLVTDLCRSRWFWCDLIGFDVRYERPEDLFAYLGLDGAEVMLEQRQAGTRQWLAGPFEPPLGRGMNLQFVVPAVAPILDRLAGAGWPLFMAVEDKAYRIGGGEHWQRQFLVQDPDGYLLRPAEILALPA